MVYLAAQPHDQYGQHTSARRGQLCFRHQRQGPHSLRPQCPHAHRQDPARHGCAAHRQGHDAFQQIPYYYACPKCRKKATETGSGWYCQEHQEVEPEARFRLSGILDDGTGTIRTTFFGLSGEILTGMSGRDIQNLIDNNLNDNEIFTDRRHEAEGKTVLIQGRVKLQTR